MMKVIWMALSALGGALLMYVFDAKEGKTRLTEIKNKMAQAKNRVQSPLPSEIDEDTLTRQVKTEIAHLVATPTAINVTSNRNRIILSGALQEDEVERVLAACRAIPGVAEVENRLQPQPRESSLTNSSENAKTSLV